MGKERQASCEAKQLLCLSYLPVVKGFFSKTQKSKSFQLDKLDVELSRQYILFPLCLESGTIWVFIYVWCYTSRLISGPTLLK